MYIIHHELTIGCNLFFLGISHPSLRKSKLTLSTSGRRYRRLMLRMIRVLRQMWMRNNKSTAVNIAGWYIQPVRLLWNSCLISLIETCSKDSDCKHFQGRVGSLPPILTESHPRVLYMFDEERDLDITGVHHFTVHTPKFHPPIIKKLFDCLDKLADQKWPTVKRLFWRKILNQNMRGALQKMAWHQSSNLLCMSLRIAMILSGWHQTLSKCGCFNLHQLWAFNKFLRYTVIG